MSTITEHTPLEVLLNDPVMKHFNWAFVEGCNTELAQLRATAAGRLDALNSWAELWRHICTRLGAEILPNAQNFDAMIAATLAAVKSARDVIDNALNALDLEGIGDGMSGDLCRTWLAAHPAPAPEPSEQDAPKPPMRDVIMAAHVELVRLGNELNWEEPVNEITAGVINLCREYTAPSEQDAA